MRPPRRQATRFRPRLARLGTVDEGLVERATYRPHEQHCSPIRTYAPHKTKCPRGIDCRTALGLLKDGLRRSMVPDDGAELPPRVWAVDDATGIVYEGRITNADQAEYHGFPLLASDPFTEEVVRLWAERADQ